jgi:peptidyl-prolyl cis-trans isomerase SurA
MRSLLLMAAIPLAFGGGVTIDQIVAVVGRHPIKKSDIERDLRVTQFLNGEPPDFSLAARRKSLSRLIDQELIRSDMAIAGNGSSRADEAQRLFEEFVKDRFGGSNSQADVEMRRRGLTQAQLLQQLQWQLVVLRFIDQRFRPGVFITDDEVRNYYDEHLAQLKQQYATNNSFESLEAKIRENLEAQRVNKNFEDWLDQARKDTRVDYKEADLK